MNKHHHTDSWRVRYVVRSEDGVFFFQHQITDPQATFRQLHGRELDNIDVLNEMTRFHHTYWDLPDGDMLSKEQSPIDAVRRLMYRQLGLTFVTGVDLFQVPMFAKRFRLQSPYRYVVVTEWDGVCKRDRMEAMRTSSGRPWQWIPPHFADCYSLPSETITALDIAREIYRLQRSPSSSRMIGMTVG